ncbi:hypothetical protein [Clostridium sp. D43t1_170807_H7]|uniref:hypothetical protein n=1 Tax=Clostridium sp. D43t1_170807_H7 TaxID=2787140 RepID=UPI0018996882|nr:hypothetical protein [Clostridium sp. D43t1_170807_H7]
MDKEMQEIYDRLKMCVELKNISGARGIFDTILLFYGKEVEFINVCIKLCNSLEGFFEEFDNEELIYEPSLWTQEYLENLQASIPGNYSKERINLLIQINKYIELLLEGNIEENNTFKVNSDSNEEKSTNRIANIIVEEGENKKEEEKVELHTMYTTYNASKTKNKIDKKAGKDVNFMKATGIIALLSAVTLLTLSLLRKKE